MFDAPYELHRDAAAGIIYVAEAKSRIRKLVFTSDGALAFVFVGYPPVHQEVFELFGSWLVRRAGCVHRLRQVLLQAMADEATATIQPMVDK